VRGCANHHAPTPRTGTVTAGALLGAAGVCGGAEPRAAQLKREKLNVRCQERTKESGSARSLLTCERLRESPRAHAHRDSCGSSWGRGSTSLWGAEPWAAHFKREKLNVRHEERTKKSGSARSLLTCERLRESPRTHAQPYCPQLRLSLWPPVSVGGSKPAEPWAAHLKKGEAEC
jgi:hypothetical protein